MRKRQFLVVMIFNLLAITAANAQLMNRAEPLPGITSAGQPDEAALEAVAEEGYVAVIDLRSEAEDRGMNEKEVVEALGMQYISLPVAGADGVTFENAEALDAILAGIDGPVLLHCASSNRVGGILALRERMNGASAEDSMELGLAAGMRSPALQEAVESKLSVD